jgi:alkylated DNA repair protein (DNA oxidative demethylase)
MTRHVRSTPNLFDTSEAAVTLAPGATLLRGFVTDQEQLKAAVDRIAAFSPFRHMMTPGGRRMSVAMTSCGAVGWLSDRHGYRYDAIDPDTGTAWPAMPEAFVDLAAGAASRGGFTGFAPDACLINRYEPGTKLSLHVDRDERDFSAPIVSVSLGLPAVFLFGGLQRGDPTDRVPLFSGDVVVWGGPSRLRYHGVLPLDDGHHPLTGRCRINLTFRTAR